MSAYLYVTLAAAIVAFGSTFVVLKFSLKYKLYPAIRSRDVHTTPTPRLGGIAVYIGALAGLLLASRLPAFRTVFEQPALIGGFVGAITLILVLGVVDDLWDLDWFTKLAGQALAAWLLAWSGFQIVSLPINGVVIGSNQMSLFVTIFFIVLVMNAVNFIDGLDGLVSGVMAIASASFLLYSYLLSAQGYQSTTFNLASLISALALGVCLGFLPFNWHPAKIFLGDSGALVIALMLAASSVSVTGQVDPSLMHARSLWVPTFIPLVIPFATLVLPLLDFSLAVFRRLRAGKSPFAADRLHLHHRMLNMGHGVRGSVILFYCWTALFSVCSLLFMFIWWPWVLLIFLGGAVVSLYFTYQPIVHRFVRHRVMRKLRQSRDEDHAFGIERPDGATLRRAQPSDDDEKEQTSV